jgi:hypothetical protein
MLGEPGSDFGIEIEGNGYSGQTEGCGEQWDTHFATTRRHKSGAEELRKL